MYAQSQTNKTSIQLQKPPKSSVNPSNRVAEIKKLKISPVKLEYVAKLTVKNQSAMITQKVNAKLSRKKALKKP